MLPTAFRIWEWVLLRKQKSTFRRCLFCVPAVSWRIVEVVIADGCRRAQSIIYTCVGESVKYSRPSGRLCREQCSFRLWWYCLYFTFQMLCRLCCFYAGLSLLVQCSDIFLRLYCLYSVVCAVGGNISRVSTLGRASIHSFVYFRGFLGGYSPVVRLFYYSVFRSSSEPS